MQILLDFFLISANIKVEGCMTKRKQSILIYCGKKKELEALIKRLHPPHDLFITQSFNNAIVYLDLKPDVIITTTPFKPQIRFFKAFKKKSLQQQKKDRLFTPSNTICFYENESEELQLLQEGG